MTEPIIRVQGLGKRYKIGQEEPYGLLTDRIADLARGILKGLRGLTSFRSNARNKADGHFWALKDVSFDVMPGEVLGVVGRNGSGKSTLLKVLSRITSPAEGRIEINGRVACLLEVGTGFHPELTGRENVFLNGAILGMPRKKMEEIFDQIVDYAEIGNFIDTPVKHYSSGMKIRLGFSVAVHLESEILIIDEVLSVGDAAFQRKSMATIQRMHQEGRTILFVTHNTVLLSQIASRCIYLDHGQLREAGSTDEVVNLYMEDVLSATSLNFQEGVPMEFQKKLTDPAVTVKNLSISGTTTNGQASSLASGEPAVLSFEVLANKDVEQVDPRILFIRDRRWFRWDQGHSNIDLLSLKAGETQVIEVAYPSFPFCGSNIVMVVYVAPDAGAPNPETISDFNITPLKVERRVEKDSGPVYLDQSWRSYSLEAEDPDAEVSDADLAIHK